MARRVHYQPKHALRSTFTGTPLIVFTRRPYWPAVFLTAIVALLLISLGGFIAWAVYLR